MKLHLTNDRSASATLALAVIAVVSACGGSDAATDETEATVSEPASEEAVTDNRNRALPRPTQSRKRYLLSKTPSLRPQRPPTRPKQTPTTSRPVPRRPQRRASLRVR